MKKGPMGMPYDFSVVIRRRWSAVRVGAEVRSPVRGEDGGLVHFTGRGKIVGKIGRRPGKESLHRITVYVRTFPDREEGRVRA